MYKSEPEAKAAALKLSQQDSLPDDAYVALFNKDADAFIIYPKVSTLLFKAAKTGFLAGKDTCVHTHDETGKLISSQTSIYKLVMDQVREFHGDEVFYEEYKNAKWHNEKPHMFMSKVALAVALRQAFAENLAGLITYEEAKCDLDFHQPVSKKVKEEDFTVKTDNGKNVKQLLEDLFPTT